MNETWRRGVTVAGFILCAAASAADLRGQVPWVESGRRVTAAGHLLEGPLPTVMPLAAAGRTSHGLDRVSGIQGAGGSRSHPMLGAAVGFALGAGTTYLVLNSGGSTSKCDRSANQDAMGSGACVGAYVLGGLIGAGVGAGVGALIHTNRWESFPLRGLGVAVLPERRVGIAATLKW